MKIFPIIRVFITYKTQSHDCGTAVLYGAEEHVREFSNDLYRGLDVDRVVADVVLFKDGRTSTDFVATKTALTPHV